MSLEVRFCHENEVGRVMDFIGRYWAEGHVLSTNEELMRWQHSGSEGRDFNYVVAVDGSEIRGVLGFIPSARFDSVLKEDSVLWLALWKTRDDAPVGTGLRMLAYLRLQVTNVAIGAVGINASVASLYKRLGFEVSLLHHSYVLNPLMDAYSIPIVPRGVPTIKATTLQVQAPDLYELGKEALLRLGPIFSARWPKSWIPRKTALFFANRYLDHPTYNYRLYSIVREGEVMGLLVIRQAEVGDARFVRIVDGLYPAEALPRLGESLQGLLVKLDAEGADLYHHGLNQVAFSESGLMTVEAGDGVVIPNYFEPFTRSNVPLAIAYKSGPGQHVVVVKGDGDQDRPNWVEHR